MVTDLNHYLDLPPDVPAPARRLAEQLGNIVRAATAADASAAWETALPCRRRAANRPCPGRMVVQRTETEAALGELLLLDADCERAVFRIQGQRNGAVLSVSRDELDELIGAIAAEANHEPNRRRQQRLDAALNALEHAAGNLG